MVFIFNQKNSLSVALLIIFLNSFTAPAHAAPQAALVVDADTDAVLWEQDAKKSRHPASLTKIMTLYLIFDALQRNQLTLQQRLPVSQQAAARPASKLGLQPGETISVEQAIFALVIRSANDVATVVAEALGGTEARFARQMTKTARHLGMQDTIFRNASGLPDSRQVTTAWDMYLLAKALQRDFPDQYRYFSKTQFRFRNKRYRTHNHLLTRYPGADGIKTGFIRASGYNLVTSVRRDPYHLIAVVFGGDSASARDAHMQILLDQGFAQLQTHQELRYAQSPAREAPAITLISRLPFQDRTVPSPSHNPLLAVVNAALPTAQADDTVDPGSSAAGALQWKIQVGAFSQLKAAEKRVLEVIQRVSGALSPGQATISPVSKDDQMLYRAWFGGFSETEANSLCTVLEQQAIDCFPVEPLNS